MKDIKYCCDCKWSHLANGASSSYMRCRHPYVGRKGENRVSPTNEHAGLYCSIERGGLGGVWSLWIYRCGSQGLLWEPKK